MEIFDFIAGALRPLLYLALLGALVGFPVYVVGRFARLRRDIEELKRQIAHLQVAAPREAPAPVTPPPAFAPPNTAPTRAFSATLSDFDLPTPTTFLQSPVEAAPAPTLESIPVIRPAGPDLESVFGMNWLARLGIAAIAFATAFFLQYAFRSGWIGPMAQVTLGLCGAMTLLGTGQYLLTKPRYNAFAQVLSGGGIVVYFLSIYAAYAFYQPQMMSYGPAFAAFAVGALAASALALANRTPVIAALSILGAFAAPALIQRHGGSGPGDLTPLYAYVAALNVWVFGLLRIRPWHLLAVVAFAGTWLLFFGAGPLTRDGWATEGFAGLFFLFAVYAGARALYADDDGGSGTAEPMQRVGLALILLGCLAFTIASAEILADTGALGLPAVTVAGILVTLTLGALAALLPDLGARDRDVRSAVGYFAAVALAVILLGSIASAPRVPHAQAPVAFGFILFNFLLFLALALLMHRRLAEERVAAALTAANAVVHAVAAGRVLGDLRLFGVMPADAAWMPLASGVALGALYLANRSRRQGTALGTTLAGAALAFPTAALVRAVASGGAAPWPAAAIVMIAGEYLLLALAWLALRGRTPTVPFRTDLVAPAVNAALFFGLMARALGSATFAGLSLLAVTALAMAVFHAAIGLIFLSRDERGLLRLIYLGLAATFVAVAAALQLKAGYVTVAWAAEACALIWAGLSARDHRVRAFGLVLLVLATVRTLLMDLPSAPGDGAWLLLNVRMLAGAAVIAAAYLCAWFLWERRSELTADEAKAPVSLVVLANALTLIFVSVDLYGWFGRHVSGSAGGASAPQLALSVFWTLYALAAVSVGIWRRNRPLRLLAMALLCLSVAKAFLFDLSWLQQPYRIVSFFTLGVILLLVSLLYTRFEEWLRAEPAL